MIFCLSLLAQFSFPSAFISILTLLFLTMSLKYISVCRNFLVGCRTTNCTFAHSIKEIIPALCRNNINCVSRDCSFYHDNQDFDRLQVWRNAIDKKYSRHGKYAFAGWDGYSPSLSEITSNSYHYYYDKPLSRQDRSFTEYVDLPPLIRDHDVISDLHPPTREITLNSSNSYSPPLSPPTPILSSPPPDSVTCLASKISQLTDNYLIQRNSEIQATDEKLQIIHDNITRAKEEQKRLRTRYRAETIQMTSSRDEAEHILTDLNFKIKDTQTNLIKLKDFNSELIKIRKQYEDCQVNFASLSKEVAILRSQKESITYVITEQQSSLRRLTFNNQQETIRQAKLHNNNDSNNSITTNKKRKVNNDDYWESRPLSKILN